MDEKISIFLREKHYELCKNYVNFCRKFDNSANSDKSKQILNDITEYEMFCEKYFSVNIDDIVNV